MVLSMPSPYKHPATGVYWYRQRVPVRLVGLAKGKSVSITVDGLASTRTIGADLQVSLRTKLPAEAKRLAPEAQAEFERIWQSLTDGPVSLTNKQIVALSGEVYHIIKQALEDDPGEAAKWAARRRRREEEQAKRRVPAPPTTGLAIPRPDPLRARLGTWVDGALFERHITVDDRTYQRLLEEFDRAVGDVATLLERRAGGDYSPDAVGQRFPAFELAPAIPLPQQANGVTLTQLVDIWTGRLSQAKPQTIKTYRSIIERFVAFLGHDDAAMVTDMDIVRWHEALVRPATVTHDTFIKRYRAAISTVYAYSMTLKGKSAVIGLGHVALTMNPAAGLKLEGPTKVVSRSRTFTTDEANKILRAALEAPNAVNNYAGFNRDAMRWVPWVCAYTGARAGEVCQLRKKDFIEIDGVKCIALLPDAGTIKSGRFRHVPLHPHLVDEGLWAFAMAARQGPLFYNDAVKSEQPWVQTVQLLGEWVRNTAKVTDERISPNHGWRHWFKTKGRTAGIPDTYLDVICGHTLPTQGGKYGDFEPAALLREINKLPAIILKPKELERP